MYKLGAFKTSNYENFLYKLILVGYIGGILSYDYRRPHNTHTHYPAQHPGERSEKKKYFMVKLRKLDANLI